MEDMELSRSQIRTEAPKSGAGFPLDDEPKLKEADLLKALRLFSRVGNLFEAMMETRLRKIRLTSAKTKSEVQSASCN
jgi:hypothetical protein